MSVAALPQTVLVVDDEPQILRVLGTVIGARGLEVVTAATGEEAVERLRTTGFGCLVVDKNLPGIDGLAVLHAARREQPHCATILMTGYSSTSSAIEALRLGASDYVEKPFSDIHLVAEKIELAMRARRTAVERDQLAERIRAIQGELLAAGHKLSRARTEIDMFEQVFEFRVRQATDEVRHKLAALEVRIRDLALSGRPATTTSLMKLADDLAWLTR